MITDAQLRLSGAQSMNGTGTVVSTNTVDLLSANRNIGRGQPARGVVTVDATMAGGTSIQPQFIQSANADLSSPDVLASGPVVALAGLVAGAKIWDHPLPDNTKRYVGYQYVRVGTFSGAGTLSAHIVSDTDFNNYVPSNTGY